MDEQPAVMSMKCFPHLKRATSLALEERPRPKPGPAEVLIKVAAAGLCHSDVHILAGSSASDVVEDEYIMGHETSGTAEANGPGAGAKLGQLYAVLGINPCVDKCDACREHRGNQCTTPHQFIGLGRDGGFAEYLVVPETALVAVPANVTAPVAAVATDAVLTPWHALKTRGNIQPGMNVAIIGIGGLGLNAVEIALLLGAKVFASDVKNAAMEAARALGATTMNLDQLVEESRSTKFQVVVDAYGSNSTFTAAQHMVARNGLIIITGMESKLLSFSSGIAIMKEVTVKVSFWGTAEDLKEVLQLISEGKLNPTVRTAPLAELPRYIEEMKRNMFTGRMAFVP